ncbi:MAG: hypothetical protein WD073_02090 [Xanthobacteraceae bacterium]
MTEYQKFSDLEHYLFKEVGPRFRSSGKLKPLDLFLILHWKSWRAKKKARDRLKKIAGSFDKATKEIAASLHEATNSKERMQILMQKWRFRLPTATAILSVLYPKDFTIYDIRVRTQLRQVPIRESYSKTHWDTIWISYIRFKQAVKQKTPRGLCLRDKDRYLWGKSVFKDAQRDRRA